MTARPSSARPAVLDCPLDGTVVVEASAGTGKTYTITQLYLRLLLEVGLAVDEILVVTFTTDATHELRDRVRNRVLTALAAIESGAPPPDDGVLAALLARHAEPAARKAAHDRLRLAVASFDQAAIFTIHGFCQRMLAEQAFECAQPFVAEVVPEPRALAQAVVDDLWRRETHAASPQWAAFLVASRQSPEALLEAVWSRLDRPDLELLAPDDPGDVAALEAECLAAWNDARTLCRQSLDQVETLLAGSDAIGRTVYRADRIRGFCAQLRDHLAPDVARLAAEPPPPLARFTASAVAAAARRGRPPLSHPLFDAVEAAARATTALHAAYSRRLCALRARAREALGAELRARKIACGVQSYGDLLVQLAGAVAGERGDALVHAIRRRFRAAMIDEFQDTDPIQWAIFRRVFADGGAPLVLVGDPKQAIYSFRGADVFTYVAARDAAAQRWPLSENWRSDASLVHGVNALFDGPARPFLLDEIGFTAAVPAAPDGTSPLVDAGSPGPPLRLWFMPRATDQARVPPRASGEARVPKGRARERAARAVAAEIARLLADAARGDVLLEGRPLRGSDVAVLVRTHYEAGIVRTALLALGVGCVERAQDSVFSTAEALELERVLRAVAEPGHDGLVRAALATELLGRSAEQLTALADDERGWTEEIERFQRWRDLWRGRTFARMFRALVDDAGIPARLLAYGDGERRLTNLLHLGELLHAESMRRRIALDTLTAWMAERRQAEQAEAEEHQLRLESDAHLVQLVTVHASKGLEYPVVFVPFAWDGLLRVKDGADLVFHDAARGQRACLAFGPHHPPDRLERARAEELAESIRLLYVAVTRAKHRCTVVWGAARDAGTSPLGWVLHPPAAGAATTELDERFDERGDDTLRAELQALATRAPGAITVQDLPCGPGVPLGGARGEPAGLQPRPFPGAVPDGWRVASFSTLAAGRGDDAPDHDAARTAPPTPPPTGDVAAFPGGARAGSAVHAVFERHDFTSRDPAALEALVQRQLRAHGIDVAWVPAVAQTIERALATPLTTDGGVRLDTVAAAERMTELEFTCPLDRLDAPGLAALCRQHGFAAGPVADAVDALRFDPVTGYVRGFIDLVFRADGRYWLADWKTNWLGPSRDDYRAERLPAVIARESYWLQYLLYSVVVHRLLGQRVDGYDYDAHFGGAFYLFVRGMDPSLGPASGVFLHKPPRGLVEALAARLRRDPREAA